MDRLTRRRLGQAAGGIIATAAAPLRAHATAPAAARAGFDIVPYVNPELRRFVPQLLAQTNFPLSAKTLPLIRKAADQQSAPPLPQPGWGERTIPGRGGAPEVRVYVVNAGPAGGRSPGILMIHGGGFAIGSARGDIRQAQEIAAALGCVVVCVDYRLPPETRYPGPLEDCYAALAWLHADADRLGVDSKRIAVMGGSAGGGLAAMLALAARDRGEVQLAYQVLIYPMLDDRTGSTEQKPPYQGALAWTPEHNRFGWTALLGAPAGSPQAPAGAVPARVENLRGLPPAFIGVGSIDLFVDEDIQYARRLVDAGVPVTLDLVPGAFHGFDLIPGTQVGVRFRTAMLDALREALKPTA